MLRTALIAASWIAIVIGAVCVVTGRRGPGIVLLVDGAVVFLAIVFERWRYHRGRTVARQGPQSAAEPSGDGWERTGERFEDPETHEIVEVQFNPRSGERRYVRADAR